MKRWLYPVVVLLSACASAPMPEDHFYRLSDMGPEQSAVGPRIFPADLRVERLRADGLHSERALLYSDDPGHRILKQYHYHFWTEAPPILIRHRLVSWLRRLDVAKHIHGGTGSFGERFVLGGRLVKFEHVRFDGNVRAVVEMELELEDHENRQMIFMQTYKGQAPIVGDGMEAVVQGYEQAIHSALSGFRDDLYGLDFSSKSKDKK